MKKVIATKPEGDYISVALSDYNGKTDLIHKYEKALRFIANLWPTETTAKIGEVYGINDGRSRAILAEEAVTIARNALSGKSPAQPQRKVLIQVEGGVAEVLECPDDVDVTIDDKDGQDAPDSTCEEIKARVKAHGDGKAVWEKDHPPLSAEVIAARAGILPHDPQDDEPESDEEEYCERCSEPISKDGYARDGLCGGVLCRTCSMKDDNETEESECNGDGCKTKVYPEDPYFATPCGTFCTEHMREHSKDCPICRNEFDTEPRENCEACKVDQHTSCPGTAGCPCCEHAAAMDAMEAEDKPQEPTDREKAYINWARENIATDEIEIDDGPDLKGNYPKVSEGPEGAFVAAWVWVSKDDACICRKCNAVYDDGGDGFDGLCGECADKDEEAD